MSTTRTVTLALIALAGVAWAAFRRWNRALEQAVALPQYRHPSIPGSLIEARHTVVKVPPELSERLQRIDRTEVDGRCSSYRRDGSGNVAHSCSFHPGHENDHRDVHTGATWS